MDTEKQANVTRRYRCPHCGMLLETEEPIIGMQVSCPGCGGNFVATPVAPEPRAEPTAASTPRGNGKKWLWGVAVLVGLLVLKSALPTKGPPPGTTKTIKLPGGATMEMVWCPPGKFMMGSPEGEAGRSPDETLHRVKLTRGFWIAQTEVTQSQWRSVMGSNPSQRKGDSLPVENVQWDDCVAFCKKTGMMLPTEAQWEYACRAGSGEMFSTTHGNFHVSYSSERTEPVGSYSPNAWGIFDMHGNVWEWCADWYGPYPDGKVTNPTGPKSGKNHVLRGGAWNTPSEECRSANRYGDRVWGAYGAASCGFRPIMKP